jgi:hypothetical protein
MIRVRLTDPIDRHNLAQFMTYSNLTVREEGDSLLVDFSRFDLTEDAQSRIVERLVEVWRTTRTVPT